MPEKILAIIFSLLILAQAGVVRCWVGTWIFPACLFALFWFLFTFIPLVALFWVPIEPLAVGFILLCCVMFSLSSIGLSWPKALAERRARTERAAVYDTWFLRLCFYGATVL